MVFLLFPSAKPPEAAEAAAAGSAGAEAQAAEPESGSGGDRRTEPVAAAPTQHNGAAEPAPAPGNCRGRRWNSRCRS